VGRLKATKVVLIYRAGICEFRGGGTREEARFKPELLDLDKEGPDRLQKRLEKNRIE